MSPTKVSYPALLGNAEGFAGLTLQTVQPDPLVITDLDLVARKVPKDRARQLLREAGGIDVGNRVMCGRDKFLAFLDAKGKTLAPAPKAPKKATPTARMTAVEIAEAAGITFVKGGASK